MSENNESNFSEFKLGLKDGIPVALGYFAVSFSLGIAAKKAGLTPFQSGLTSFLCSASAGEYAGFDAIASCATIVELVLITLIVNARYFLMSVALTQNLSPKLNFFHRLVLGFYVTDELFALSIARPKFLNPRYTYGMICVASPGWTIGTFLGTLAGNILPDRVVSALSVALYGMFIAVIIPEGKKNRVVSILIVVSFLLSYLFSVLEFLSFINETTRTILLTVIISSAAAIFAPVKDDAKSIKC